MRVCSPDLSAIECPNEELNDALLIDSENESFEPENSLECTPKKLSFNCLSINLEEKNGNILSSLVDTGSAISLIKSKVFANLENKFDYVKKLAPSLAKPIEGSLIALQYKVLLEFKINGKIIKHYFYLFENKTDAFPGDILLGFDILNKLDFKCNLSETAPIELLGTKFAVNNNKDNKK